MNEAADLSGDDRKTLKIVEESRVGFCGTVRIGDLDARYAQSGDSQAHRHPMVVVCFDPCPLQRSWIDADSIVSFID